MSKHTEEKMKEDCTPTPWRVEPVASMPDCAWVLPLHDTKWDAPLLLKDAQRIVACVNALEGINPEAVPEMLAMLEEARKVIGPSAWGTLHRRIDALIEKAKTV